MKQLHYAAIVALTSIGFYSSAATQTINVIASIDTSISLTKTDGQPIDTLEMHYTPGGDLNAVTAQVRINTNSQKDTNVRLDSSPVLGHLNPTTGVVDRQIPLTVNLGGTDLQTTNTLYKLSEWFNKVAGSSKDYDITSGSKPMVLTIRTTSRSGSYQTGQYTGAVNLIIEQATSAT